MIKLLSEEVEDIINRAWVDAAERKQEYLLLENILFTAMGTKSVQGMMDELDVDWKKLRAEVDHFLSTEIEKVENVKHPKQTVMFKKMLQHLIFHTQNSGKISQIEDLLIVMFNEPETTAVYLMSKYGIDDYTLKELATDIRHPEDESTEEHMDEQTTGGTDTSTRRKKKTALEQYAINLTEAAKNGKLDPIIGRNEETERAIQILCRKKKNNPLLLGDSGVGKCLAGSQEITIEVDDDLYDVIMSID